MNELATDSHGLTRTFIRATCSAKNSHRFARKIQKKLYKASPSEIRSAVVNEFHGVKVVGGEVAEDLFDRGLCLPSGTAMTDEDLDRIIKTILKCQK